MLRRMFIAAKDIESEVSRWQERIDIIRHKLKFIRALPAVACIEGLDPLQTAGDRVPALVEIAGGNALNSENGRLPAPPDIIVLMLPGKTLTESLGLAGTLMEQPWVPESPAFRNERLYVVDCHTYFQPSGEGLMQSIEILAEIINAGDFYFGFEGTGWTQFVTGGKG
ncbi:MAG: hypothetical protein FWJ85_00080 [Solitalea sp.]